VVSLHWSGWKVAPEGCLCPDTAGSSNFVEYTVADSRHVMVLAVGLSTHARTRRILCPKCIAEEVFYMGIKTLLFLLWEEIEINKVSTSEPKNEDEKNLCRRRFTCLRPSRQGLRPKDLSSSSSSSSSCLLTNALSSCCCFC